MTIQEILNALQPYVIGIRYIEGMAVVDTVFKDGWILPESKTIKKVKGNDDLNYYMIFSDNQDYGLDALLDYVSLVMKENVEREKKHELLKQYVADLKEIFKKNSLTKLRNLKMTFTDELMIPELDTFNDITIEEPIEHNIEFTPEPIEEILPVQQINNYVPEQLNNSDDEDELLMEERRAETFRLMSQRKKQGRQISSISQKIELPPKKILEEVYSENSSCDCGSEEACSKCVDSKDF